MRILKAEVPEVARLQMVEGIIEWGVFCLLSYLGVFSEHFFINSCKLLIFKAILREHSVLYSLDYCQQQYRLRYLLYARPLDASHPHALYLPTKAHKREVIVYAWFFHVCFNCLFI